MPKFNDGKCLGCRKTPKLCNCPAKTFALTHNNYTEVDKQRYRDWEKQVMWMGEETGENGTPHLQIVVTFKKAKRNKAVRKMAPGAHVEVAVDGDEGGNYCLKETYEIDDRRMRKGTRTDLTEACALKDIKSLVELYPETFVKFHAGFEKLFRARMVAHEGPREVVWLWGAAGVGKSRRAHEDGAREITVDNGRFSESWYGSDTVVFNDVREDTLPYNEWLRITDRYPIDVKTKGGFVPWAPKKIYITSDKHPSSIFFNAGDIAQFLRRVTVTEVV